MKQQIIKKNQMESFFLSMILIALFWLPSIDALSVVGKEILTEENEFGGPTIEYTNDDNSIFIEYFDADSNIVRKETIFTADYPIDNGLDKIVIYYFFGKKVKEERIFTERDSRRTLIERSINHFDRNTGVKTRSENHFIEPYSGYNVVFREEGKKIRIEWHFPKNLNGIQKNIVYFDKNEVAIKTESIYTEKTAKENGYYKRIYYNAYNANKYLRKLRQEWFFTDDYAAENGGKYKKVENFHYKFGKLTNTEIHFFDKTGSQIIK